MLTRLDLLITYSRGSSEAVARLAIARDTLWVRGAAFMCCANWLDAHLVFHELCELGEGQGRPVGPGHK